MKWLRVKNKTLFYFTGDQDYYIPNNKLPFQQGIGYTLLVWYYPTGNAHKELLANKYLWEQGDSGYTKSGDKGFGVALSETELIQIYKEQELSRESVRSYYWDSKNNRLLDNSVELDRLLSN